MLRRAATLCVLAVMVIALGSPALAHEDLVSSDPVEGAVTAAPVSRIELVFSGAVRPSADDIRLYDANGSDLPLTLFQPTEASVIIEPDVELTDGAYALAWQVVSDDDFHAVSGALTFSVDVPGVESSDPVEATVTTTPLTTASPGASGAVPFPVEALTEPVVVDQPDAGAGEWPERIGRWATMTGALLAIGALAFAASSLVGTEDEARRAFRWIRVGAVLVLAGTVVEVVGVAMVVGGVGEALRWPFGVAVLLRVAGGVAMLQDPRLVTVSVGDPIADPSRLNGFAGGGASAPSLATAVPRYRVEVQHEWVTLAGVAAVASSFLFYGHAAGSEATVLSRTATLVHVVAAGVWLGGLIVLGDTLARRWRASMPLDATSMAVRFSRVAAAALVLAAVAGAALAWTIADTPSDLYSGSWGRTLLAKVAFVGIAAGLGAYNHFAVVPRLMSEPGDAQASDRLRRVVRIEGAILLVVVAVTATLVGIAP